MTDVGVLAAQVARVRAEVTALVGLDLDGVDGAVGPGLHAELRTAVDQVAGFAARVLARVEADGRWEAGDARTFGDFMAGRSGASVGAVRREVGLGRALESDLPGTAARVAAGGVSLDHARVLARVAATSPARRAALAGGEEAVLLERAAALPVDQYRREVARWAARVDAEAAEVEHERACAREYLTLARRPDGVAVQGFLTLEHASALATALRAVAGVPAATDPRTVDERQAAALVDAARLVLDRGLAGGGQQVRPHLSVHVSWETLTRLAATHPDPDGAAMNDPAVVPAQLQDGDPIPASLLARIACDSELTRIVFGPRGDVLDVGRAQRTYTGQQRRAVIARDRTCRYPGCRAPVGLGEVHHTIPWAAGGPTSVATGVLLCWYHHDLVHRRHLQVRPHPHGGWQILRPDGTPLPPTTPDNPPPPPATPPPPAAPPPDAPPPPDALPLPDTPPTPDTTPPARATNPRPRPEHTQDTLLPR